MLKQQLARIRVHLVFAVGIILVLSIGVITRMSSGERFTQALWNTVKEGRPVEWLMVFLFWYAFAFPPKRDRWTNKNVTGLELTEQK